jgi:hypothetical protein
MVPFSRRGRGMTVIHFLLDGRLQSNWRGLQMAPLALKMPELGEVFQFKTEQLYFEFNWTEVCGYNIRIGKCPMWLLPVTGRQGCRTLSELLTVAQTVVLTCSPCCSR